MSFAKFLVDRQYGIYRPNKPSVDSQTEEIVSLFPILCAALILYERQAQFEPVGDRLMSCNPGVERYRGWRVVLHLASLVNVARPIHAVSPAGPIESRAI